MIIQQKWYENAALVRLELLLSIDEIAILVYVARFTSLWGS
jgi:hypothetical protein